MPAPEVTKRLVARAVLRAGGLEALARKVGVKPRLLKRYLAGTEPLPDALFLRIVDVIEGPAADSPEKPD